MVWLNFEYGEEPDLTYSEKKRLKLHFKSSNNEKISFAYDWINADH